MKFYKIGSRLTKGQVERLKDRDKIWF